MGSLVTRGFPGWLHLMNSTRKRWHIWAEIFFLGTVHDSSEKKILAGFFDAMLEENEFVYQIIQYRFFYKIYT